MVPPNFTSKERITVEMVDRWVGGWRTRTVWEMLDAAHASALHWNAVGTELNRVRAKMLLAEVHSLLGLADSAMAYADEVRGYFIGRDAPDWEIAFVHAIHAHAAATAGDADTHRQSYEEARRAVEAIADDEDRKIVLDTFAHVPPP